MHTVSPPGGNGDKAGFARMADPATPYGGNGGCDDNWGSGDRDDGSRDGGSAGNPCAQRAERTEGGTRAEGGWVTARLERAHGRGSRGAEQRKSATRSANRRKRKTRRGTIDLPSAPSGARADLYSEVTARVIGELEAGRMPWVQPWSASACGPALPRNALTGRAYSGINVLILWGAAIGNARTSQRWLTFRQALEAGGAVRKGERGTGVVFANRFIPEAEQARAAAIGEDARSVPFLKRFTLFNLDQIDGLDPARLALEPAPLPECEAVPVAEALIAASGVAFHVGGDKAWYSPDTDRVQVPPQPAFFAQIDYYRTALHELTHATGHRSRLDRDQTSRFGTSGYAREELIAEMGSAFLCAALGIVPTVRHADYIGSWLTVLREDKRAIFRAASAASKASDWLLARLPATTDPSTDAAKTAASEGTGEGPSKGPSDGPSYDTFGVAA